jgi:hypothetical protein
MGFPHFWHLTGLSSIILSRLNSYPTSLKSSNHRQAKNMSTLQFCLLYIRGAIEKNRTTASKALMQIVHKWLLDERL